MAATWHQLCFMESLSAVVPLLVTWSSALAGAALASAVDSGDSERLLRDAELAEDVPELQVCPGTNSAATAERDKRGEYAPDALPIGSAASLLV
eukprot:516503-Prorocentrum_minimum.AAC.1